MSYSKLLIEIARRRQYKEAAENIVRGMMVQLQAMSEGVFLPILLHICFLFKTMSQRNE
jgi:hypothetical protein